MATTIVAASIPVLRVLVRHVQSSARKYYRTGEGYSNRSKAHGSRSHTVVISTRQQDKSQDDQSDTTILNPANGRVMMTNEIAVSYQYKKDGDSSVAGYEMDRV